MAKSCLALNKDSRKEKTERTEKTERANTERIPSHILRTPSLTSHLGVFQNCFRGLVGLILLGLIYYILPFLRSPLYFPSKFPRPFSMRSEFLIHLKRWSWLYLFPSLHHQQSSESIDFHWGRQLAKVGLHSCVMECSLSLSLSQKKTVISTHLVVELSTKPTDYAARSAYV